jgi:hypothetical protein
MLDADQYDPEQAETMQMVRDLIQGCLHLTVPSGRLTD